MKRTAAALLYVTLGVALACPCNPDPPNPPPDPGSQTCVAELATRQCDQLCPPTHRIAPVKAGSACVVPSESWSAERVAASEPLAGFCRYTWTSQEPPTEETVYPANSNAECHVLPTGDPALDGLRSAWRDTLGIEALAKLRTAAALPKTPVRIAVIDDARKASRTGHGVAMAAIIEEIACDTDSSAGAHDCEVVSYPALHRQRSTSSTSDHGDYGLPSDVALAIVEAVDDWHTEAREAKLVINLSIGWENACAAIGEEDIVHAAIEHATKEGALVFAASGNRPPSTCVSGPLAPAVWAGDRSAHGAPLLFAVTAVDDANEYLPTFRPGSAASLEALGFMAVASSNTRDPSARLGPLSGSSVSTAVASASAALAWRYRGDADATAIVMLMREAGDKRIDSTSGQPRLADFGPTPLQQQRVISPCSTMAEVVGMRGTPARDLCQPKQPMAAAWPSIWPDADPASTTSTPGTESTCCLGAEQPGNALAAWVGPQPGFPACLLCGVKGARAAVRVDPNFQPYNLVATELTLWNRAGQSEQHSLIGTFSTSTTTYIDNEAFRRVAGAPAASGYITMHFDVGGTMVTAGNVVPVSP